MQASVGYPELESRLWNWSDWSRTGHGLVRNRCGSAERLWRPTYPTASDNRTIDHQDAAIVERGLTRLPERERLLLVGTYYHKANPQAICRKCKVAWTGAQEWILRLRAALCALAMRLA